MSGPSLSGQRALFSIPEGVHYLNCAFMSPLSRRAQAAGAEGLARESWPGPIQARDFFDGCAQVRRLFSGLIGVNDPGRIALVPSVSYGLATVARNTRIDRGQGVVTVHEQFPSNVHVWRRLCEETGGELRVVESPSSGGERGEEWSTAVVDAIGPSTGVVAIGVVHWTDGTAFDLVRIGARAREVGAALVIDGSQAVGALPFDVSEVRPDALVCAGYKWLMGAYSLGVAYYGTRYDGGVPLEESWAAKVGSEDFSALVAQRDEYRPGAARYEVGEAGSFILVPILVAALEQLTGWGVESIQAYARRLVEPLLDDERLPAIGIELVRPRAWHLFGLRLPDGVDPTRTAAGLAERGVHVSVRGRVVRVSPHVYNDEDDIEALVRSLVELVG